MDVESKTHASALSRLPVTAVTTDDVLRALKPIWIKKSDTAGKVGSHREHLGLRRGHGDCCPARGPNPASWKGPLGKLLPPLSQVRTSSTTRPSPRRSARAVRRIRAVGAVSSNALGFRS